MRTIPALFSLVAFWCLGLTACDREACSREELPPEVQLEKSLWDASELAGFLLQHREVTMLDLEKAIECSRRFPVTPLQAMDAVRAYVQEHPEEGASRGLQLESLNPERVRLSVFDHYYFFFRSRSRHSIKARRDRLIGFFVDARSGVVIPYPRKRLHGNDAVSPYRVMVHYPVDDVGKILLTPDDPKVQRCLGMAYLRGAYVPRSPEKGAEYLRRAADQGDVRAQSCYADCCWEGLGVPVDRDRAIRYYRMAVAQEAPDGEAACKLGHCYARGEGVSQSWAQAAHWYCVAADAGNSEGCYSLAECYEKGMGVPASREKAIEYYKLIVSARRDFWESGQKAWASRAVEAIRRLEREAAR